MEEKTKTIEQIDNNKIAEKQKPKFEFSVTAIFQKINMIFAMVLVFAPVLQFLTGIIGKTFYVNFLFDFWYMIYVAVFLAFLPSLIMHLRTTKFKDKSLLIVIILTCAMLVCVIISGICNKNFGTDAMEIFGYVLLFICIFSLDKKSMKIFIHAMLGTVAFSALLGLIDPWGQFMPGFSSEVQMASFFFHPNYSANIVGVMTVVVVNFLMKEKRVGLNILYSLYFCIFSLFLYLNGSFVGITGVYFALIIEFIAVWIKTKKFPWKLFVLGLAFVAFAFIIELYPNLKNVRTCQYNYFIEAIAAFDNVFHTNLLGKIMHISEVPGADGWERDSLILRSLKAALGEGSANVGERIKTILFGLGGGTLHTLRPHNMIVGFWDDFGVLAMLLHETIIGFLLVYFIKYSKENRQEVRPYFYAAIAYLFITMFGSLIVYHYVYFMMILAIGLKTVKSKE